MFSLFAWQRLGLTNPHRGLPYNVTVGAVRERQAQRETNSPQLKLPTDFVDRRKKKAHLSREEEALVGTEPVNISCMVTICPRSARNKYWSACH